MRARLIIAVVLLGAAFGAGFWCGYRIHAPSPSITTEMQAPQTHRVPSPMAEHPTKIALPSGERQEWHQMVHVAVPITAAQTQPTIEEIAPTRTASGELTFNVGDSKLTFDPRAPERAKVEHTTRCFAAFVTLELPRNIKSTLTEARFFRIDCGAEAGSEIEPVNQVANVTWEVRTLAPVRQSERAVTIEQSVGLGASFGGWRDISPCVTYSFLRLGRLRLPSAMADAGGHLGAGIQARIWKPFHAGGFCAWDVTDDFARSVRITATANF